MKKTLFKLIACLLVLAAMPALAQKPANLACSPTSGDFAFVTAEGTATIIYSSSNMLKDGTRATNNTGWFKVDDFRLQYLGRETDIKTAEAATREATVNVATPTGLLLRQNVKPSEALRGLPTGLYIVGGKKIIK